MPILLEALKTSPAVFLNGPRQAGKSTLAYEIAEKDNFADYISFDDLTVLAAASADPEGFLRNFNKPIVIDEVQLVPQLFRVIKKRIDELRHQKASNPNGFFLLTGSANVLALPELADALVGRMQIHTLYPLSVEETLGKTGNFIPNLFNEKEIKFSKISYKGISLKKIIAQATFPQIASEQNIKSDLWFTSYLTTLLQRDVRALAEIEKLTALPNMLKLMATRVGGILNDASLARDAGLNIMTYRRYRTLLHLVFLLITIPPWYRNISKRLMKSPKIFFVDTRLLCYLLGFDLMHLDEIKISNPYLYGSILENFVASELTKQLSINNAGTLYHFRTNDNKEIDFIIERRDGKLIAIEVKSKQSVSAQDFATLKLLQEEIGNDFVKGIVLYQGENILPFGKNLYAMSLNSLWELG